MASKPRKRAARARRPGKSSARAARAGDLAERIVDAAVARAERVGWDDTRLADVAADLGRPLPEVLAHFRDKDALAGAWFLRAMDAMLGRAEAVRRRPARERIEALMLAWFEALAASRTVSAQMIRAKLYPAHPHHWVPLVFSLSRTVQWLRDAAALEAKGARRQLEEIGLSALLLGALAVFCRDQTPNHARTRAFIGRGLAAGDRCLGRLCRRRAAA